jgi:hypothetical protein
MVNHKVGEIETIKYRWNWHECQVCGMPASWEVNYLAKDGRRNPASSAYGKDDCSWCKDATGYACRKHQTEVERDYPEGMSWASSFSLKSFKHLGFYKTKL